MFKGKKLLLIGLLAVLAVVLALIANYLRSRCVPTPAGCPDPTLKHTAISQYKYATSYGDGSGGYVCSRPIKLVSNTIDIKGNSVSFYPVDAAEAKLFCHMTYVIEYKGKIKILQRPEVLDLIGKYEYKDVSIKALEFDLIQDKDFVNRLLPKYRGREIGCIIILETPNEKLVYLEDENLETFERLNYELFEKSLKALNNADRELFLSSLN